MQSTPETRPTPAMRPAPGASLLYMFSAASGATSRNGVSGSSSISTRSRGSSLPRATCLARGPSPPPWAILASRVFRSSTSARIAAAFALKSSVRGFSLDASAGMASPLVRDNVTALLPLPLGEGWGEGRRCAPAAALTLTLSQGEREQFSHRNQHRARRLGCKSCQAWPDFADAPPRPTDRCDTDGVCPRHLAGLREVRRRPVGGAARGTNHASPSAPP